MIFSYLIFSNLAKPYIEMIKKPCKLHMSHGLNYQCTINADLSRLKTSKVKKTIFPRDILFFIISTSKNGSLNLSSTNEKRGYRHQNMNHKHWYSRTPCPKPILTLRMRAETPPSSPATAAQHPAVSRRSGEGKGWRHACAERQIRLGVGSSSTSALVVHISMSIFTFFYL